MLSIDKECFQPSAMAALETFSLGKEQQPVLKIENCMRGIDQLRAYAVAHDEKFSASDSYYPGVRLPMPMVYAMAIAKFFGSKISRVFGVDFSKVKKVAPTYSIVTFKPDQLSIMQRIPHFDAPDQNSLAMVHYLCAAKDAGTALYRHRKTQYEYVNEARYESYMRCVRSQFPDPGIYPNGYICGDTPEYEQITSFDAVYNRLIMYRGSSLHSGLISPDYSFDSSPATGRLTVTTFFEFKR